MKNRVFWVLGLGGVVACNRGNLSPDKNLDWFGHHDVNVYSYVLVSANQQTNRADTPDFQINVSAAFIDSSTSSLRPMDSISVADQQIFRNVDNSYSYLYQDSASLHRGLSLFGSDVAVHIEGAGPGDTLTSTVYLPKKIVKLISDFPDSVDRTQNLTLSWQPDTQCPWGQVVLQVYYYPNLSRARNPLLPQEIKPLNRVVPDMGTYTLEGGDLARFPAGSLIGISIARGSQSTAYLPISRCRVYLFTSSSASTSPLVVTSNN